MTMAHERVVALSEAPGGGARRGLSRRHVAFAAFGLVAAVGAAALAWFADREPAQGDGIAIVPLIRAEAGPAKAPPDDPGGIQVPHQSALIYDEMAPANRPPAAADAPEAQRPADQPVQQVPAARPERSAAAVGAYRVQLAALKSRAAAARHWKRLKAKHRDLLGGLDLVIQKVDLGGKTGVVFRLQAGALASRAAGQTLCARLGKRKVGCLLVNP